ncbi:Ubiquinone/menaquinone biosynthesis C-methyltransferase UbiE [uncultured archaeon]|nr:Ubiquinone/menaquinone biosynthesis C-methyltransferase UbiE [uncultured archaeon]
MCSIMDVGLAVTLSLLQDWRVKKEQFTHWISIHLHSGWFRILLQKKQLTNVETICSDSKTGLPDNSIDVVLLYDVIHDLDNPDEVLEELHRVLKLNGILSVSDHHMKENEIVSKVTNRGLFRLSGKGERTYSFMRGG